MSGIPAAVLSQITNEGRKHVTRANVERAVKLLVSYRKKRQNRGQFKAARKSLRRNQPGDAPGTGLTKQNQYRTDGWAVHNGNVLNAQDLVEIPRISNTFSLNSRMRDIVYLSGFKICFAIENEYTQDLYVNVAVISSKNRGDLGDGTDFFRSYAGEGRQKDWGDATLNAMDRHCLPINSDEHFIHMHERRLVTAAKTDAQGGSKVAKVWNYETYIPINRQIRFEGSEASPETKFQICHWVGKVGETIIGSNVARAGAYRMDMKVVTFFKEPLPVLEFR